MLKIVSAKKNDMTKTQPQKYVQKTNIRIKSFYVVQANSHYYIISNSDLSAYIPYYPMVKDHSISYPCKTIPYYHA